MASPRDEANARLFRLRKNAKAGTFPTAGGDSPYLGKPDRLENSAADRDQIRDRQGYEEIPEARVTRGAAAPPARKRASSGFPRSRKLQSDEVTD